MIILNARTGEQRKGIIELIAHIKTMRDTKAMTLLEVGSFVGNSACIFAEHFEKVICVDAWDDKGLSDTAQIMWSREGYTKELLESEFDKNTSAFSNIEKVKGYSCTVAKDFIRMVDIVYIDADHTYESAKSDILAWKDKARYFVAGHDYWLKRFPGVIKAVDEVFGKPDKVFSDTSWIVKK
jgi:hypothetical protein